jgi:hypothetical protein
MTPWDDSQDEMRGPFLDRDTADRLLAGAVEPDDAPPGYAQVARLIRAAVTPPTPTELIGEEQAVAAAARVVSRTAPHSPVPATRRSTVRSRFFRVRIAGLVVAGTVLGTTGLAAAGVLPDAAQNAASSVLSSIGISVPTADEHPASTGTDISGIATTTGATGVDKGAEISSAASGGMSQAGVNGEAAGTSGSAPVTTPNPGGTGTADTASGGAADTGTATADEASQEHSSAGSGNADGHTP